METVLLPVVPEQPEFVTVTDLVPADGQAIVTLLVAPLMLPPPEALHDHVELGVQLLALAVKLRAWSTDPEVEPVMKIEGLGGGVPELTLMMYRESSTCDS